LRSIDARYRKLGFKLLCGIDEAGRGPLAGSVYAAAVILPAQHGISGIDDSKKLSPQKREYLYQKIIEQALDYKVISISEGQIEKLNILGASKLAMEKAVRSLKIQPDFLLIDALNLNIPEIPQLNLIKGDARSESIAAASILAKVARDRYMLKMHALYPEYNFAQHKGYGTAAHIAALRKHGPCEIHRISFISHFCDLGSLFIA